MAEPSNCPKRSRDGNNLVRVSEVCGRELELTFFLFRPNQSMPAVQITEKTNFVELKMTRLERSFSCAEAAVIYWYFLWL